MRAVVTCITLGLAIVSWSAAGADGIIYTLPDDRAWATFDAEITTEKTDGSKRRMTGRMRIASVGTQMVDGQPCRWLEFDATWELNATVEATSVIKLLIPEAHLGQGKTPYRHIERGWIQVGSDEPQPTTKNRAGELEIFLVGPPVEERPLDPVTLEINSASLECDGLEGTTEIKIPARVTTLLDMVLPPPLRRLSYSFVTRLHESVPFGVVSHELSPIDTAEGDFKMVLTLVESDAESRLPEYN